MLRDELLERAKVKAIAVKHADARVLIIEMDMPADIDASYDLRDASWLDADRRCADGLCRRRTTASSAWSATPAISEGEFIEVVMGEAPLKAAMIRYGLDILGLSILISIITAALVYLSLDALLVKPMTKLTWNIVRFSERPEDPTSALSSRPRAATRSAPPSASSPPCSRSSPRRCRRNRRLAALGLAVSKISHDLRNMLSSAQLLSDRLITVKDPTVQRLVPKLIASLDRAIRLCARTLDYGQAQETPPRRKRFPLAPLVTEIGDSLGLPRPNLIDWTVEVEAELEVDADRDQLYRVLSNLCRNAVQALEGEGEGESARRDLSLGAREKARSPSSRSRTPGPGVPEKARAHLFEAFQSVARKGGSGLGLAIAAELVQAHGGQIALTKNEGGATFRVTIPDAVVELERARRLSA